MKDELGDRMKNYEMRSKSYLPTRTYAIIRLDGKAFHTYTKGLERPFDEEFASDMNETTKFLCENIQGARMGYVQSDEISILITDFDKITSQPWFDYQVQKMASIASSMATAKFNHLRMLRKLGVRDVSMDELIFNNLPNMKLAFFDARVFSISDPFEVHNYFVWRQKDCTRNSISMAAQSIYSHKQLEGVSSNDKQEMMHQKDVNWNDYPVRFKRGGLVHRETYQESIDTTNIPEANVPKDSKVTRSRWITADPPVFTKELEFTYSKIPVITGDGVAKLSITLERYSPFI